jgi:hypothetical protein
METCNSSIGSSSVNVYVYEHIEKYHAYNIYIYIRFRSRTPVENNNIIHIPTCIYNIYTYTNKRRISFVTKAYDLIRESSSARATIFARILSVSDLLAQSPFGDRARKTRRNLCRCTCTRLQSVCARCTIYRDNTM